MLGEVAYAAQSEVGAAGGFSCCSARSLAQSASERSSRERVSSSSSGRSISERCR